MEKGRDIPKWLDAELLFRLNYGPSTSGDIGSARKALGKRKGRTEVTLLDRAIAAKLHKALYNWPYYRRGFETDWSPDLEHKEPTPGISPFDYDSSVQTFPLVWTENFVINNVWGADPYASSIIGKANKPPLAAIVMDMIALVQFLQKIPSNQPKKLVEWNTEFIQSNKLHSTVAYRKSEEDWAARGYIADLFSIVTGVGSTSLQPPVRFSVNIASGIVSGADRRKSDRLPWTYQKTLPGSGVLFPTAPPVSSNDQDPSNSVAELKASFIQDGPFKLKKTRHLDKHFTFTGNNRDEIRLYQYWGTEQITPGEDLPKYPSMRIYQHHTLRRFIFWLDYAN